MRFVFSSAFAAASLLVVACTGAPTVTPATTAPSPPNPAATATPTPVPTTSPRPTSTAEPVLSATLLADHPVLDGDDLDDTMPGFYGATLPAAYFTDSDATQHLYVVGFGPGYGTQRAFHATSTDGLEWTVDSADPLASFVDEFSPPGPVPGTVIRTDEGGWVMYFWGVPAPLPDGAQIYRATADDPAGPWSMDPEPVLALGEPGEVDDRGLDFPSVVENDDGFVMLYGGVGGDRPQTARALVATSVDGVSWQKRGRVMEPELCGGASTDYIGIPRLFRDDDGYLALTDMSDDIYALTSVDALEWTCQAEPVFAADTIEGNERVHTLAAARVGADINLMIEALFTSAMGEVATNLWLAQLGGL